MQYEQVKKLLKRFKDGESTEEELILVNYWLHKLGEKSDLSLVDLETAHDDIWLMLQNEKIVPKTYAKLMYFASGVSIVLLAIVGILFFRTKEKPTLNYANDISPGGYKAFLTLSNGKKINLINAKNGQIAKEAGLRIIKTKDGQLVYTVSETDYLTTLPAYNTIRTPKGGTYQIVLPDSSVVWLNAASSIKFPSTFRGLKERKIELFGEAYFEIKTIYAPDEQQVSNGKRVPFSVITRNQIVTVLGTHFNINSYPDEPAVKTTLLEGSVKVTPLHRQSQISILKPGQQSVVTDKLITVVPVDTEEIVAWKNGDFVFKEGEDFKVIMRKIARWYDVEVDYDASAPKHFSPGGWVSRAKDISSVLSMMEKTNEIHFKVKGRKITVLK